MHVSRTSDKKAQPKGEHLIPRQFISTVRVTGRRGFMRLVCSLGAMGAAAGIILAQRIDLYEGPVVYIVPAVAAAGTVGLGVAGYYIGKKLDTRVTEIRVVAD